MWEAFTALQREHPNDWELWCTGTGELYDKRREHPKIRHFGFVQPAELGKIISETGVFLLPSHFEPWGVVAHEFAAAGFPLLCSDEVMAAGQFLKNGENGFIFPSDKIHEMKSVMKKIVILPDEQLVEMGNKSHVYSQELTPDKWTETLLSVVNKIN